MNHIAGRVLPLQCARGRIQRVDVAIAAPKIHDTVRYRRRGKVDVERIGIGFAGGHAAVDILGDEPMLALSLELPLHLPAGDVERDKVTTIALKVNQTSSHRWRRSSPHSGWELPFLLSRFDV